MKCVVNVAKFSIITQSIKNKSKAPLVQKISNSTLSNPIHNNVKQL